MYSVDIFNFLSSANFPQTCLQGPLTSLSLKNHSFCAGVYSLCIRTCVRACTHARDLMFYAYKLQKFNIIFTRLYISFNPYFNCIKKLQFTNRIHITYFWCQYENLYSDDKYKPTYILDKQFNLLHLMGISIYP